MPRNQPDSDTEASAAASDPTTPAAPAAASDTDTVKVRVPQQDGEIRYGVAGDDPSTYPVNGGVIEVPASVADRLLLSIDGSERVGGNPSAAGQE